MLYEKRSQPVTKQPLTRHSQTQTLIVLPVFNEARFVDDILRQVLSYTENVLVINDGSTDGTSAKLKRYSKIKLLSHPQNRGYGRSLIDAFAFATANAFDWLITIDADHQHEPAWIPRFYRKIRKDDADIISGSRYLVDADPSELSPPADRVAINRQITGILNNSLGLQLTDAFCGFKAYRVKTLSRLCLTEEGYGLPLQLWIQAVVAGLRIREIPVPIVYHDPNRNFAGELEDPEFRLNYYLGILEKELEQNGFGKS